MNNAGEGAGEGCGENILEFPAADCVKTTAIITRIHLSCLERN